MNRTLITDNLYQYQFPPEEGKQYGFNLYALASGEKVLLIDTAYEQQAAEALVDLVSNGYGLEHILISHFHPDHISGLNVLPAATVWGSDQYAATLDEHYAPQEQLSFSPVQTLSESSRLEFGAFTLSFRSAPGHSCCSMFTIIDEHCIHVADNLIAANDGTPILPWSPLDQMDDHIRSLQLLKELQPQVVLLGHGKSIAGEAAICAEIDDRLKYLYAVRETNGAATFEEATTRCSCRFLYREWHASNSASSP